MENSTSVGHTIGAAVIAVAGYFLLLYLGAPIIEWLLDFFGRWFVPERFGGGSETDSPGLPTLLFRVLFLSGVSAWVALSAGFKMFEDASPRIIAVLLSVAVVIWAGYLLFLVPKTISMHTVMMILSVVLVLAPPLYFAYTLWVEESWD
jgi:hypothetical protein